MFMKILTVKPGTDTSRLLSVETTLLLDTLMIPSGFTCQLLLALLNPQQLLSSPLQTANTGTIFTSITTPQRWQLSLSSKEKATISKPTTSTGTAPAISEYKSQCQTTTPPSPSKPTKSMKLSSIALSSQKSSPTLCLEAQPEASIFVSIGLLLKAALLAMM